MKIKNILILILLSVSIVFTACSSDSSDDDNNNNDYDSNWSKSADGNILRYEGGTPYNKKVPSFAVSAEKGFSVMFTSLIPEAESPFDWYAYILSYENCYITIPNLDPWNNTISNSSLRYIHIYPYDNYGSWINTDQGLSYKSAFDGNYHLIKITFSSNSITFFLDNIPWVIYSRNAFYNSNGMQEFIGYYVTALNSGELVFNSACLNLTDVVFEKN